MKEEENIKRRAESLGIFFLVKLKSGKEMSPGRNGELGTRVKREALWEDVRTHARVEI